MTRDGCDHTAEVELLERGLARARSENPALSALFEAFGPILMERARLRQEAPGWPGRPPRFDAEVFCQGTFLLSGKGFKDMSDGLPAAADRLLPVLARSFPALAGEFEALGAALGAGLLSWRDLARAGFGRKASAPGVSPAALAFAASELVRPLVERQARDLRDRIRDLPWSRGRCPVCGSGPAMSVLRPQRDSAEFISGHGGRRFLRCGVCSTEWTHKRVSCPGCGCEEPEELAVLASGDRPFERVDACRRCKTYVPCLDAGEMVVVPDPDLAALVMLPLILRAREQGFEAQAELPWTRP